MKRNGAKKIGRTVQGLLDRYRPPRFGFRLNVVDDEIERKRDWWYVTVVPDRGDVRAFDYANALSEIEEKLQDEQHLNVLLVPLLVDE
ncbi:MAG: hypothetical protein HUU22_12275 [Phycisphaerae bacterium]|nr:hypothetical protein [Phycisphaerae bacterium]NUQ46794.1 hypothetical protein [Phycisphaerae bacterium]